MYREFTRTFAAMPPTGFHVTIPITPDKNAVRKVPYASDALSDQSVAVVAMAVWRVWTWSGVGVYLEGIFYGSNTR